MVSTVSMTETYYEYLYYEYLFVNIKRTIRKCMDFNRFVSRDMVKPNYAPASMLGLFIVSMVVVEGLAAFV